MRTNTPEVQQRLIQAAQMLWILYCNQSVDSSYRFVEEEFMRLVSNSTNYIQCRQADPIVLAKLVLIAAGEPIDLNG